MHDVVRSAIEKRRTRNGEALLRALASADPSRARAWGNKELLLIANACKRRFGVLRRDHLVLGISSDAARLGDPPEEPVASHFWSPALNAGAVGAPQVAGHMCRNLGHPHKQPNEVS